MTFLDQGVLALNVRPLAALWWALMPRVVVLRGTEGEGWCAAEQSRLGGKSVRGWGAIDSLWGSGGTGRCGLAQQRL